MSKWKSFTNFVKSKILTKTVGYSALGAVTAASLIGALSYKVSAPFKPSFYNYKQYISDEVRDVISKHFDFKEFDTLNQFTNAILTRKAVAGIGSDSQAVTLIQKGQLQKLNFHKLFPQLISEEETKDDNLVAQKLKSVYSESVWEHLQAYDKDLTVDDTGKKYDGPQRHLWQYFVPYFVQDMVVAYNPAKVLNRKNKGSVAYDANMDFKQIYEFDRKIISDLISTEQQNDPKWNGREFSLYSILKVLRANGFENMEATDAVRDNMVYGSAFKKDANNNYTDIYQTGEADNFSSQTSYSSFKQLIDQYKDLIESATGYSLQDPHINFIGSGGELVDKISDPTTAIDFGTIYNGDAFDAYFANDNHSNARDGQIRYLRPKNNLVLVDGFIIVNGINDEFTEKAYEVAKNSFINGIDDADWSDNSEDENPEDYLAYVNFDTVGYTPAYKQLINYVKENYFTGYIDPEAQEAEARAKGEEINPETSWVLHEGNKLTPEEWKQALEYESHYIQGLFDITSHYTIWMPGTTDPIHFPEKQTNEYTYTVKHSDIKPVSARTLTDIEAYWSQKIKK
ncbi:type 2 periplasmic-binding domain-containing protein [Mycoplasmopsis columbinasalis]|uniref:Spermidine/putrescine ABC transporter substrate-binding protein n=1 Tax=Mycoplasmopsis columbinasalis TaxID=114880 RepID=A0A449BB53_9BACT|nr:hypothetical protein [Mycoplasmopsis columbinasalis]VEU78268.1 Uncharacterised protein [Mycoplasmopsis columbinasalis]